MKKSKRVIAIIVSAIILQSVAATASITAYGYTDSQTEATQAAESVNATAEQEESATEYATDGKAVDLGDSAADSKVLHFGNYEYEIVNDTVTIVKYTGDESSVKIPDTINGYSVTKIGEYAFEDKQNLTEVIFPDKLESIGDFAFLGCVKLKKVDIPQTVTEIGQCAVGYFAKNNNIYPTGGVVIIGHKNEVVKKYAKKCGYPYKDEDVIEASKITLNRDAAVLGVGENFKITATLTPQNAVAEITYQSNNVNVAKVLPDGTVKAVGTGEARITVMTNNGKKAYCNVTVRQAPNSVSISKSKMTLGMGEKYRLSCTLPYGTAASDITYTSSNNSVVQVDEKTGEVTAKGVGNAKVTVKTYNGKTAVCNITVRYAPSSVGLNKTKLVLGVGEQFDLDSYLPSGCGAYSVTYSSENDEVASVRKAGGLVTAKAEGTTEIIVKTYNGKTAVCTVTVKKAPSSVGLNKTQLVLGVGEKFDLDSRLPSGCGAYNVTYSTNNSKVATVRTA
ncbi:MAG: Ig-like domain-containing protein, partial [Ruminococcus sp.]|nr:Ig-like domain-containing protein [Ruminococcus sp.]